MKQKQYAPMSVAEMALSIYAVNNGYMDKVDRAQGRRVRGRAAGLRAASFKAEMDAINAKPELKAHEATLKKICEEFAKSGSV